MIVYYLILQCFASIHRAHVYHVRPRICPYVQHGLLPQALSAVTLHLSWTGAQGTGGRGQELVWLHM